MCKPLVNSLESYLLLLSDNMDHMYTIFLDHTSRYFLQIPQGLNSAIARGGAGGGEGPWAPEKNLTST